MSTELSRPVSCPRCDAVVETPMWSSINAAEHPNLREQIIKETLFNWTCPECCFVAQLAYPCLYHDSKRKFMLYLVPNGKDTELLALDVEQSFPQLNMVLKREVPSLPALKEKILIFEAGYDDRAVELVKYALSDALGRKYERPVSNSYFSFADEKKNRITFSFFFEGRPEPRMHSTRLDAYRRALEITEDAGPLLSNGFELVGRTMAAELLEEYRTK